MCVCVCHCPTSQCDFPVIYASGFQGIAGTSPTEMAKDLEPLFQAIIKEVSPPAVTTDSPLQMMVSV